MVSVYNTTAALEGREPVVGSCMSRLTLRSSRVYLKGYVTPGTVLQLLRNFDFHMKNECDNSSYLIALEVR